LDYPALKDQIRTWAAELGFQQLGVADLNLSEQEPRVRAWLAAGFHGEMGYLERNLSKRLHPDLLEPGTCRVISARMDYLPDAAAEPKQILARSELGYISRYALGRDYHKVLRRRLARLGARITEAAENFDHRFRAFTDSAPVLEKALAEKAGLGWIGKHTLLLNSAAGSWFFLGEIYTNIPLPVDPGEPENQCGSCRACIRVCPTNAIVGPQQLDARRCISYLTIEHKSAIPEPLRQQIGNRIFGCDDCQIYCPWNRHAQPSCEADFSVRYGLDAPRLLDLFAWSEDEFLHHTEGSAIRRISYQQWQRNLAVALGNGEPDPAVIQALRAKRSEASPLVVEHIDWALAQLTGSARACD